ncbi:hypothetical protein FOZ63_003473, partial [Perkinsus olseni]
YGFYAFVLLLINVGLLWHYLIYKKAFKNITENGANAYDDPADGKENSLLDSFRNSFYGYWNDGNCTGGECSNAGCVGSPIPFEPVVCESDGDFGRSVTDAGLKYDRTTDYLLECVDNQDRASDESVGMVTSLCYTREAWAADQKVDAMFGMIITAIFVAFLLFVLLSIVLFVSRPRTWQDDDVPLVKDSELELADLPPLEATPQEKQERSSVHHLSPEAEPLSGRSGEVYSAWSSSQNQLGASHRSTTGKRPSPRGMDSELSTSRRAAYHLMRERLKLCGGRAGKDKLGTRRRKVVTTFGTAPRFGYRSLPGSTPRRKLSSSNAMKLRRGDNVDLSRKSWGIPECSLPCLGWGGDTCSSPVPSGSEMSHA